MAIYAALADRVLVGAGQDATDPTVGLEGRDLACLAADARVPHRAFAGTVESGLQRTTDAGKTWQPVGPFGTVGDRVTSVAVSPHDADVVWAGTEPSTVSVSRDGGDTWRGTADLTALPSASRWSFPPRPHTHHVRWLEPDPHEEGRLYVAIEAGAFLRTDDGGGTWQDHPEGARRDNHTVATHPRAPGRVYVAAGDGYAESVDGGDTWRYPQSGLHHQYVWSVAVDPGDPDCVVVSAAAGAHTAHYPERAETVIARRVGDADWETAMDGVGLAEDLVRAVLATDGTAGRVYALTNRGLFRSEDRAGTWNRVGLAPRETFEGQVGRGLAVV